MNIKHILVAAVIMFVVAIQGLNMMLDIEILKKRQARMTLSGEEWIDRIALEEHEDMLYALKHTGNKMILVETVPLPDEKAISQTLKYRSQPGAQEVRTIKTQTEETFCPPLMTLAKYKRGLSKRIRFVDPGGAVVHEVTFSKTTCAKYG